MLKLSAGHSSFSSMCSHTLPLTLTPFLESAHPRRPSDSQSGIGNGHQRRTQVSSSSGCAAPSLPQKLPTACNAGFPEDQWPLQDCGRFLLRLCLGLGLFFSSSFVGAASCAGVFVLAFPFFSWCGTPTPAHAPAACLLLPWRFCVASFSRCKSFDSSRSKTSDQRRVLMGILNTGQLILLERHVLAFALGPLIARLWLLVRAGHWPVHQCQRRHLRAAARLLLLS